MKEQLKQMSTADLKVYLDILNDKIGEYINLLLNVCPIGENKETIKKRNDEFSKNSYAYDIILEELNDRLNVLTENII